MRAWIPTSFVFTGTAALFIGACATTQPKPRVESHWVQDQRIQEVMHVLGTDLIATTDIDTTPNAAFSSPTYEARVRRDKAMKELRYLGGSLAESAAEISQLVKEKPMPTADCVAMVSTAELLADQSMRLSDLARAGDAEGVGLALNEIRATCNSCHTRYRDHAGSLAER